MPNGCEEDSEKSIRAIVFGISVMLSIFASTRRGEAISEGKYDSADPNEAYPLMLEFIAGGIHKVMSAPDAGRKARRPTRRSSE